MINATTDMTWSRRLANYWTARNHYIEAGRAVRPSANVQDMLSQVQEPVLAVLRLSPEFRPAYEPLLRMATMLSQTDLPAALALLKELTQIQPERPEAEQAYSQLSGLEQ